MSYRYTLPRSYSNLYIKTEKDIKDLEYALKDYGALETPIKLFELKKNTIFLIKNINTYDVYLVDEKDEKLLIKGNISTFGVALQMTYKYAMLYFSFNKIFRTWQPQIDTTSDDFNKIKKSFFGIIC